MATTNFAWTNAAVRTTGVLTDNGTFLSRSSKYFAGQNNEFAVNFTGTDLSLDYVSVSSSTGLQLSLDGAAFTTPTLTTGTGSWKTLAAVAGASDTEHTLIIRDNGSGGSAQTIFDFTNGFAVTGAAPAVAAPTGYGTVRQLTTAVAAGYVKITSGTASSGSQGNTSYADSNFPGVGFRFVATCDVIKIFAYCNGKKIRLTIDGVDESSPVTLPNTSKWQWVTVKSGIGAASAQTYRITAGSESVIFFAVMAAGGTEISTSTLAALPVWAFYGDSITNGQIGTSNDETLAHPHLIAINQGVGYIASGRSSTTLKNYGSGGANVTTQSGETRVAEVTAIDPDAYVVLYGVNDAANVGGSIDAAAFQTSAETMLTSLAATGPTKIYVLGILNTTNATATTNRTAYNTALSAAATAVGSPCQYISTDGWITPAGADCSDGLHPTATGYDKIKTAFLAAIAASASTTSDGPFLAGGIAITSGDIFIV